MRSTVSAGSNHKKHEVWESVNVVYVNVRTDEQLAVLNSATSTCALQSDANTIISHSKNTYICDCMIHIQKYTQIYPPEERQATQAQ